MSPTKISTYRDVNKKLADKCIKSLVPIDLYTLQHREKEALIDFASEVYDPSLWMLDIIFVLDCPTNLKGNYKPYENLMKEILVDAENYYHSCIHDIFPDATIDDAVSCTIIKFDKENDLFFCPDKSYSYLNLKDLFKILYEDNINRSVCAKENLFQTIFDGIVSEETFDVRDNSNKFLFYFMENVEQEVSIPEDTLRSIRRMGFNHNIINFSSKLRCNFISCLSQYIQLNAIVLD